MAESFDNLAWWQFELKIREFTSKTVLDHAKISSEFSKLLLTNLILINAGGMVSFPTTLTIVKALHPNATLDPDALVLPFVAFVAGLALSLITTFIVYLNFMYLAQRDYEDGHLYLASIRSFHPAALTNTEFKDTVAQEHSNRERAVARYETRVKVTYWIPFVTGWAAALLFAVGVILLSVAVYRIR